MYSTTLRTKINLVYVPLKDQLRVELLLQGHGARDQLHELKKARADIEHRFRGPLEWREKEDKMQCRVFLKIEGGYDTPETEWPDLHDQMIAAMVRLDKAIRPEVDQLPKRI